MKTPSQLSTPKTRANRLQMTDSPRRRSDKLTTSNRQVTQSASPLKASASNPFHTVGSADLLSAYQDQTNILRKIGRSIEKVTPSTPWRELESYKLELNQVLEFFDREKKRLDHCADLAKAMSKNSEDPPASETTHADLLAMEKLSAEIESLRANALEVSVELEMQAPPDELAMEEVHESFFLNPKPLAAYRSLRQYHSLLERLLNICKQCVT